MALKLQYYYPPFRIYVKTIKQTYSNVFMPFFAGLEPLHFDFFFFWQISAPQKVNSGFPEIVQTSTAKNKLKLNYRVSQNAKIWKCFAP